MRPYPFITAALFAMSVLQGTADTFIMKDGSKLEGKILREENGKYVIEVQVTRTIKDEKTIAKADVAKIEREKPDLKAFESIAPLVPVPDMLSADQYSARIQAVEKFLKQYPYASKSKEAQAILATLTAEANEVLTGGIKIGGQIIPAADYAANTLEIDARGRENQIRELIGASRFLDALRAFADFDRDFKGTQPHTALVPLIIQTISRYTNDVQLLLSGYDNRLKDRETGLSRMPLDVRRDTEAAIAADLSQAEQRLNTERATKLGWVTVHPFLKPTMEETLNFGKQELTRLNTYTARPPADSGKAYREALQKIHAADKEPVRKSAIAAARSAGVSPKYLAKLEAAAKR